MTTNDGLGFVRSRRVLLKAAFEFHKLHIAIISFNVQCCFDAVNE